MTQSDDFERGLAGWLIDDAAPPPPGDGLAATARATSALRPLPAWRAPIGANWVATPWIGLEWHAIPDSPAGRLFLVALLSIVLITASLAAVGALTRDELLDMRLGRLAYDSWDGGLVIADSDGTDGTPGPDRERMPVGRSDVRWSPDGRWLLAGGNVMDRDGRPVGFVGGGGAGWSPDSTRIAIWTSYYRTIGIVDVGGRLLDELTVPNSLLPTRDVRPEWMPDGNAIFVANMVGPDREVRPWLFPLDGSSVRPLLTEAGSDAAVSPDGSRIALVTPDGLLIARADGTTEAILLPTNREFQYLSPTWSPRGDRVAVTSIRTGLLGSSIEVVDVRTGDSREVEHYGGGTATALDWDPSGTHLLVAGGQLLAVSADGSGSEVLYDGRVDVADWQWISCADPATREPGCAARP